MTSDPLRAVERLRVGANEQHFDQDECIVGTSSLERPEKPAKGGTQALKEGLERDFLTPQTSFDAGWLNRMQQYVTGLRGREILLTRSTDDGTFPQTTRVYMN